MTESKKKYLLPSGFKDYLFDDAEAEFAALVNLLGNFTKAGYKKVSPPALEFMNGKISGQENQQFSFIDPLSQQTISLRSDITPQIARIATSRLTSEKTPLRLCYYGDIFQINSLNIQGDRQQKQVGLELISSDVKAEYDIEVLRIAVESLTEIGLKGITIDLNTPKLVNSLTEDYDTATLEALNKKELAKLPEKLRKLTEYSGVAEKAFKALNENLSDDARAQIEYVKQVYEGLNALKLPAKYTIDFVENRSVGYQEKLSFTVFAKNVRDIVGRGGRYKTSKEKNSLHATGFSFYLNNFLQALDK